MPVTAATASLGLWILQYIVSVMRRLVRVYGFVQTFSMHHKYTDTNATFMQPTPPARTPHPPLRGAARWRRQRTAPPADASAELLALLLRPPQKENKRWSDVPRARLPANQRPPGGCPAAPAPQTRMFGLENDFPTPSAPFSNCRGVITLSPSHLRKPKSCGVFLSGKT